MDQHIDEVTVAVTDDTIIGDSDQIENPESLQTESSAEPFDDDELDTVETPPVKEGIPLGLIEDYNGISSSVYEAVMIAAHRARQIGRRQKQEIDSFNRSMEMTVGSDALELDEIPSEDRTVVRTTYPKPTTQALTELKNQRFSFYYPKPEEDKPGA